MSDNSQDLQPDEHFEFLSSKSQSSRRLLLAASVEEYSFKLLSLYWPQGDTQYLYQTWSSSFFIFLERGREEIDYSTCKAIALWGWPYHSSYSAISHNLKSYMTMMMTVSIEKFWDAEKYNRSINWMHTAERSTIFRFVGRLLIISCKM